MKHLCDDALYLYCNGSLALPYISARQRGNGPNPTPPWTLGWWRSWSGGTTKTKNYPTLVFKDWPECRAILHFDFFIHKDPNSQALLFSRSMQHLKHTWNLSSKFFSGLSQKMHQAPGWPLMETEERAWEWGCCCVGNVQLHLFKDFLSHLLQWIELASCPFIKPFCGDDATFVKKTTGTSRGTIPVALPHTRAEPEDLQQRDRPFPKWIRKTYIRMSKSRHGICVNY